MILEPPNSILMEHNAEPGQDAFSVRKISNKKTKRNAPFPSRPARSIPNEKYNFIESFLFARYQSSIPIIREEC